MSYFDSAYSLPEGKEKLAAEAIIGYSTVFHLKGIKLAVKSYNGRVWLHFNNRLRFSERISLSLEEFISIFSHIDQINQCESKIFNNEQDLVVIEITQYFNIKITKSDDKIVSIFEKKPYYKNTRESDVNKYLDMQIDQFRALLQNKDEILKFTEYLENKTQSEIRTRLYKHRANDEV